MGMHEDSFHLGVKALIFNNEDKLLLLQAKTYWDIPGGRIQKNESVEEALRREVCEETGLQDVFYLHPFMMVLSDVRIATPEGNVGLIYSMHLCRILEDPPIRLSAEHKDFGWFEVNEAAALLSTAPAEFTKKLVELRSSFSAENYK